MNIFLLQTLGKIGSLFITCFASIFGTFDLSKEIININNHDKDKGSKVVSEIVEYETIYKYNTNIPANESNILTSGENGLIYKDDAGKVIKVLKEKVDEVIEIGTGKYGEYSGTLTLYGPDCDTCDGLGYVACPVLGKSYSLKKDGMYYEDAVYGKVRILAAALTEFPCGTIIEINNSDMTSTVGIVLDTGAALVNAYNKGNILIDLAHSTEKDLSHGTNFNTKFTVKRWGW